MGMKIQWAKLKNTTVLRCFICQSGTRGSVFPLSANRPLRLATAKDDHRPKCWLWAVTNNCNTHNTTVKTFSTVLIYSMVSFEMILKLRFIWSTENKTKFYFANKSKEICLCPYLHDFQIKGIVLMSEWFDYARTIYCLFYSVGEISWSLIQFPVAWFIHN